jgi:hypothetical protein
MSRASNLAGFSTSISPPANLSVGVVTATSLTVGVVTATSLTVGVVTATTVSVGGTNLITEINTKASTGKAIAMAIVFG